MSIESKRIDLILDEFEKPPVVQPQYTSKIVDGKKKQTEIVNDYVDLYKNFNDFNAKFNPKRAEEIKVVQSNEGNRPIPCSQDGGTKRVSLSRNGGVPQGWLQS